MKKLSFIVVLFFLIISCSTTLYAHPGRTDSNGGHRNSSTGEYHYHHGYSAHQHDNGICPYDFDNKTNHPDVSGKSSSKTSVKTDSKSAINSYSIWWDLAKFLSFELACTPIVVSLVAAKNVLKKLFVPRIIIPAYIFLFILSLTCEWMGNFLLYFLAFLFSAWFFTIVWGLLGLFFPWFKKLESIFHDFFENSLIILFPLALVFFVHALRFK